MTTIDPQRALLLAIDFQERLMPAIAGGEEVLRRAGILIRAAELCGIPVVFTEQNPAGLGHTVAALPTAGRAVVNKMSFDACRAPEFAAALPQGRDDIVVIGCEAHVCVLQTVIGLLAAVKRRVFVVADAVGARSSANREAALVRMARHGAETITSEMAVFEWLGDAAHPRFRDAIALIK